VTIWKVSISPRLMLLTGVVPGSELSVIVLVMPTMPVVLTRALRVSVRALVAKFGAPGTYDFYCMIHPFMHLKVTVQ